jgi:hypothetical protein
VFITAFDPPVRTIVAASAAEAEPMLVKLSAAITAPAIILRILFSFEPRVIY